MPKDLKDLLDGYQAFRHQYFDGQDSQLYNHLATQGQRPKAIIIACSDSRVDPAILLNTAPGDLFVVRNVANLVPPCECDHSHHGTSAALEFAVCGLEVHHIIVLGHSQCGGIKALVEGSAPLSCESFIGNWMALAQPAREAALTEHPNATISEQIDYCTQAALRHSLNNLRTFPWINDRIEAHTLQLHGWFFDIATGIIHAYDATSNSFKPIQ